jgi:phosphopantothenoylcysteine synthetase/decarboxylase
MSASGKPRVIKDYDKLETKIQEQIKLAYPYGFSEDLLRYTDKNGKMVSALPFETDERYYLVRMTYEEALVLVEDDEDYDDAGNLKEGVKDDYEEKYGDLDYMNDYAGNDTDDKEEDIKKDDKDDEDEEDEDSDDDKD